LRDGIDGFTGRENFRRFIMIAKLIIEVLIMWILYAIYMAILVHGKGPVGGIFFYPTAMQDRVVELGLGDLFFLDYLLLKVTGTKLHADGVKGDPFYEPKNELLKLGLPEHLILWPAVFCPVVGAISAGVGVLLR